MFTGDEFYLFITTHQLVNITHICSPPGRSVKAHVLCCQWQSVNVGRPSRSWPGWCSLQGENSDGTFAKGGARTNAECHRHCERHSCVSAFRSVQSARPARCSRARASNRISLAVSTPTALVARGLNSFNTVPAPLPISSRSPIGRLAPREAR